MDIPEAIAFVTNAILATDIPGREQTDDQIRDQAGRLRPALMSGAIHITWTQAWGVGAHLTVDLRVRDGVLEVRCLPGWPTTVYTLDVARRAVDLHNAVVTLAEKIEKGFAP